MKTKGNIKHGYYGTPTYRSWVEMKRRCNCTNVTRECFKSYKALGINYVKSWEKFENFLKDMGERPKNKTLDRINVYKGYSKNNCQWATSIEQAQNTRKTIKINYNNKIYLSLKSIAKSFNIHPATLNQRLKNGWSIHKSLTTKPGKNGKK